MKIIETIAETRSFLRSTRTEGKAIGFVPTMGALHEGHLSLARRAKKENDLCAMSIFVNPTQFGPTEDFSAYPRTMKRDQSLAEAAGVDIIFYPSTEELYPTGYSTYVEETELSQVLCGSSRPGHFRGVCTVVLKLFQIAQPDRAYFGQKDAQQLRVIEKMTEDLDLGVTIVGCPTVREPDGLALSSRNAYLSSEEREKAPALYSALQAAQRSFENSERSVEGLIRAARVILDQEKMFDVQYLEIRRWRDLQAIDTVAERSLIAVAAFLGKTRLIDNIIVDP